MDWLYALLKQILNVASLSLKKQNQIINTQTDTNNEILSLRDRLTAIEETQATQNDVLQLIAKQTAPPPLDQPAGFRPSLTLN